MLGLEQKIAKSVRGFTRSRDESGRCSGKAHDEGSLGTVLNHIINLHLLSELATRWDVQAKAESHKSCSSDLTRKVEDAQAKLKGKLGLSSW